MHLCTEENIIETDDREKNVEYFKETRYHHSYFALA
jgi:hypothetical protein